MNYNKYSSWIKVCWHVNRIILGAVFLFSGFVKAIDPIGTQYKLEDYLQAFGSFFTLFTPLALFFAFGLIATEFALGIGLICNTFSKITAWLTVLFYSVMLPLTFFIAVKNPVSDCGCFGDAIVLTNWQTFYKNLILISLSIFNLIYVKNFICSSAIKTQTCIVLAAILVICSFMFWTVKHLPIIDFRPFKIGNNIIELMEYPEDAKPDKYKISFIYEKGDKRQEFGIDDYPKNDTAWHFVDQRSILVEKGYEPPIHDFELIDMTYINHTYDILESPTPITLVIMYSLDKCDMRQIPKINKLSRQCQTSNQDFYIVTGAGPQQIADFCESVNSKTPNEATPFQNMQNSFLMCDPITLKTIVRANPGVIIVQNGIIINKYNLNNR